MRYSKQVLLKNKKDCLIRNATASDGRTIYELFNQTHAETDFLLSYPEENSYNAEQEAEFLAQKEQNEREVELCAIVDGRIVGTAGIEAAGTKDKIKHRSEFGISIAKDSWGLGIGRALIESCIECARAAGYVQIELNVVADNTAALSLYKSVGFTEYGRLSKGFRSRAAGWQELILMVKEL